MDVSDFIYYLVFSLKKYININVLLLPNYRQSLVQQWIKEKMQCIWLCFDMAILKTQRNLL